ncbi:diaminobutyrate--2-oxoglutarate transaminase [Marinicrinis sediminis]|uniref:Diaminobutyrate--2-oxoglutarate transaminase n=1 Tax=Marinicrinis sediminis TaxID=1652465 RepID=A0ABW5RBT6_9BACL
MHIFEQVESNVRSYCRSFPVVFDRAKDEWLYTDSGDPYLDFFSGAGALNYGHNPSYLKEHLIEYVQSDGIVHGLDMYTRAKEAFLEAFVSGVLEPSGLHYKVQFCGATGTNAVEAALKLARKVKGRNGIFSFMGGFHGMSLGSLSVTSNQAHRAGAGMPLHDVTFFPYDDAAQLNGLDSMAYMEYVLTDSHSGVDKPAAVIFETIQAEGGIRVASAAWMQRLRKLCDDHDILLICDDIQVGCGRTGPFLSFERAGIVPDIVMLSKSISGYGLPMSMLLMKPELDIWKPGEHNGTFRGNQLAFITGKAALEWRKEVNLQALTVHNETVIREFLSHNIQSLHPDIEVRGMGMIWGIDLARLEGEDRYHVLTASIAAACFEQGLVIERAGRNGSVLKIMPPLTIEKESLKQGLTMIESAITLVMNERSLPHLHPEPSINM